MKKQLLIIVAVVLLFVSCGKTDTPDTEVNTQQMETENTTQMESLEETTEAVSEATTEVSTEIESEVTTESETETQSESEEAQTPTYTYTDMDKTMYAKSSVNVRDLPSTDGNKLGGLSKAQEVHVTGQCNETSWYRVEYSGSVGYVSNNYLQDSKPAEEAQPTQPSEPEEYPEFTEPLYTAWYDGTYFYFYHDMTHAGYGAGYDSVAELRNRLSEELAQKFPEGYGFTVETETYEIVGNFKNTGTYCDQSSPYMTVVLIKNKFISKAEFDAYMGQTGQ